MFKKCTICKKEKTIDEFNFKSKVLGLRHCYCAECSRVLIKNHYYKNKRYYLEKAKRINLKTRLEVQKFIIDYLIKHPCIDCNEKDIRVLEFDHKKDKFKEISMLVRACHPLNKIKEEIKKCDIRCANCHRKKTAEKFRWFKNNNALVA